MFSIHNFVCHSYNISDVRRHTFTHEVCGTICSNATENPVRTYTNFSFVFLFCFVFSRLLLWPLQSVSLFQLLLLLLLLLFLPPGTCWFCVKCVLVLFFFPLPIIFFNCLLLTPSLFTRHE